MIKSIFRFFLLLFVLSSCSMQPQTEKESLDEVTNNQHLLMATLYHQNAAERDALAYQAFNFAKMVIYEDTKRMALSKQQAIIVDIDETLLDNSPYEAVCILENINYPEKWDEWMEFADAKPLPGALEFLNFAKEKGYQIFYVTNRKEKYTIPTLENLRNYGFPDADSAHLLMRKDESSKESRRKSVAKDHFIVLLIGDNLEDFSIVFDKRSNEERKILVDSLRNEFGNRYIILPNAMYGSWLGAINNNSKADRKETLKLLHEALKDF